MAVLPNFRRYFVPAIVAATLLTGFIVLMSIGGKYVKPFPKEDEDLIELPNGRVMYVVVEEEGAYIGDILIKFSDFGNQIGPYSKALKPDYFIVMGTNEARYGHFAEVYVAIKGALKIPGAVDTRAFDAGTRRPAIAVHRHFWEY